MTETAAPGLVHVAAPLRKRKTTLRRLAEHRLFMTGLVLFMLMVIMAVFADWIATHNPVQVRARFRFRAPDRSRSASPPWP